MYNVYQYYKHEKENESGQRCFENETSCVVGNIMSYHVSAALLHLVNFGTGGRKTLKVSSRAFNQEPVFFSPGSRCFSPFLSPRSFPHPTFPHPFQFL